ARRSPGSGVEGQRDESSEAGRDQKERRAVSGEHERLSVPRRRPSGKAARRQSAAALIPPRPSLPAVRSAAAECRACELWQRGTQTVFGEGPRKARLMLIGEQPGDQEDRIGRPFVGPAGQLL